MITNYVWKGKTGYRCGACAFDTLRQDVIDAHVAQHRDQARREAPAKARRSGPRAVADAVLAAAREAAAEAVGDLYEDASVTDVAESATIPSDVIE